MGSASPKRSPNFFRARGFSVIFPAEHEDMARHLIADLWSMQLKLATAESCTGGLIAALLTEVPGSSEVFERGYVTYSNEAKIDILGVSQKSLDNLGAVSADVASAMAVGALKVSIADIAVAVTGIAGPGGETPAKPIGLVYIAAQRRGKRVTGREYRFGNAGRQVIRLAAVYEALSLVRQVM